MNHQDQRLVQFLNKRGHNKMAQLTQEESKIARKLAITRGDPDAAMSLFACYVSGSEGYQENLELASKYLHDAAGLCHPEALKIISDLYAGGHFGKLKLQANVHKQVKYLRMLCFVDRVIDLSTIRNGQDTQKYYDYEWQAYATLGRLFIMNDELNNIELGHAISLKLSEENNMTESLFAMGYYWYYRMGTQYYEQALPYFERALNNDNSFWAKQALRYYNGVAQYANEEYRGPNGQIQYYQE